MDKLPIHIPSSPSYQDFDPEFEWHGEEGSYTLRIHLPGSGFKKEHVRAEVDGYGNVMTSGMRQLDSTRWSRFSKTFRIPEDCNADDVYAKFEKEVLYVIQPKVKTTRLADHSQDRPPPVAQTAPTEPQTKPKPQPAAEQPGSATTGAGGQTETVWYDYGGPLVGPTKPMQPLLNVAAAILVLACLAMYVAYKLGKATG